eukprot:Skav227026  [mRNA]  locus=scaffold456:236256:249187:+ [translate_table: standard]
MSCPRCHTFPGSPCNSCRTLSRIGFILEQGRLLKVQEPAVLAALRTAAGAITDLAEEAAPVLEAERRGSGFPEDKGPKTEASDEERGKEETRKTEVREERSGEETAGGSTPGVVDVQEERPGGKETPKKKKSEKEKSDKKRKKRGPIKEKKRRETKEEEEIEEEESRRNPGGPASGSGIRRERSPPPVPGEREVESDPTSYGLATVPRGSAARHFARHGGEEEDRRRPAEPRGAPPGRSGLPEPRGGQGRRDRRPGGGPLRGVPKAKAKAIGRAKAKAAAVGAAPKAAGRALRGRHRGALHRPAGADGVGARDDAPLDRWLRGETVILSEIGLEQLSKGTKVVIEEGSYFLHPCQFSGIVQGLEIREGEATFEMLLLGTQSESILRKQSGQPSAVFRVHRCPAGCSQDSVGDFVLHAMKGRLMKRPEEEEGWTTNLEKVERVEVPDDMATLRAREAALALSGGEHKKEKEAKEKKKEKKEKKQKKKKKKKKEGKQREEKAKSTKEKEKEEESSSSSDHSLKTGGKAKAASTKSGEALYEGTGLDPRERVRSKVARLARRFVKKGHKESSSQEGTGSSSSSEAEEGEAEHIFSQTNKVRAVAEKFPGVLTSQALAIMRESLIQEQGMIDEGTGVRPAALAYFKQKLARSCSGPAHRELYTLATAVDHLVRNRPSAAADVLIQRMKSTEATVVGGSHWTVAQKMEVLPSETNVVAGMEELTHARRETYQEAKTKALAAQPEGRPKTGKGGLKGKDQREDSIKGRGKERVEAPTQRKSEEEEPCRGDLPHEASQDATDRTEVEGYERGTELASPLIEKQNVATTAATPSTSGEAAQFSTVPTSTAQPKGRSQEVDSFPPEPPADAVEAKPDVTKAKKADLLSSMAGLRFGSLGQILLGKLLEVLPLRSKSTGKPGNKSLFPLPTSSSVLLGVCPGICDDVVGWVLCMCLSLNSLWGGDLHFDGHVNDAQRLCLAGLVKDAQRVCELNARVEALSWKDFFNVRSIDYRGEEVKVAKWFAWKNLVAALPKEIGKVPLEEVCTLGCREYVENFDRYLKDPVLWQTPVAPRVMVEDHEWGDVCRGLVETGVCCYIPESEVFHVNGAPLLNGLFGVTKDEVDDLGNEIYRLIMNLIPLNLLCEPLAGDVGTLPTWSMMNPLFLQPSEFLLVSSEDVKCFFYTMKVPPTWVKYLAFNKAVPSELAPSNMAGERVFLASLVLPMGFLNSVSIAQHVHRNLVQWSQQDGVPVHATDAELRKDRCFTQSNPCWRVYLDNYDLLEKVESSGLVDLQGTCAPGILALRSEYQKWEVPRNVKKAVAREPLTEVQGATVDGVRGLAYPREQKLARYFSLGISLAEQAFSTQRQWQVVCGGLVYISMFRRPLLGTLNRVWSHIESFNSVGCRVQSSPPDCQLEVLRVLGLLPLSRMDFRLEPHGMVTCSDASTSGGGMCASVGLSHIGTMVEGGGLRGQPGTRSPEVQVLLVSLFDGIGAMRVALDLQQVSVIGYISVECRDSCRRVVESHYPGVITVEDVRLVNREMVRSWALQFSQAQLILLASGPPCQGVSKLNADRLGALVDPRSSLFSEVPRVKDLLRESFPWSPLHSLMENVASMDESDEYTMTSSDGNTPVMIDAKHLTWANRPRLYWCSWELQESCGATCHPWRGDILEWRLFGSQPAADFLSPGWLKVDPEQSFPTFTTSRPRDHPGRKPAGLSQCDPLTIHRWKEDFHRFPPYQYLPKHCVINKHDELRLPNVAEREMILGFPLHYTSSCFGKGQRGTVAHMDERLTLLGNSWSVPVVAWLVNQLLSQLGFCNTMSPQDIMDQCRPGSGALVQDRLQRLPMTAAKFSPGGGHRLASKLCNLLSIKGEDILLSTPSTQLAKYHRHRASVPARLWKWRVISGWRWRSPGEHINSLELRAILTCLRWRLEHQHHFRRRLVHLTDSLVCLHCLSRGRSSSRKLRRTMARINALLLASGSQAVWGYVSTDSNPADKPSRWGGRRPATRRRYDLAVDGFLGFLRREGLRLPANKAHMDPLVCEYIEELWSSGQGRALACDTLAGLQDQQPNLKHLLPGAWRLLKTWHVNEVPNRAPPLPEHVVHAMVGYAHFHGHHAFAVSLLVGFYGMLRTGELLQLKPSHVMTAGEHKPAVVSLGFTKGGLRHGAAERVVLGHDALRFLLQWKSIASPAGNLTPSPATWRKLFNTTLEALKLDQFQFRPYSLRRGGATFWFQKHQSMDKLLVQGRWHTQKSWLVQAAIDPRIPAWLLGCNSDGIDFLSQETIALSGLELDVHEILRMGRVVLLTGLFQFPVCFGAHYLIFTGLNAAGLSMGTGDSAVMYCALVCAISSTMIVVKLLSEKGETERPNGRLTVGILIFQDIWAMVFLAIQPNLASPDLLTLCKQFGMIAALIVLALGYAKFVMPAERRADVGAFLVLVLFHVPPSVAPVALGLSN